jgi:hypothetical protein
MFSLNIQKKYEWKRLSKVLVEMKNKGFENV